MASAPAADSLVNQASIESDSTVFPLFFARRLVFIFSAILRLPYYLQIDIAFKWELTFLYTVFVLFFLSKFINNEDGFKI
ncbi:hypothetical protein TYRP_017042 [Tyrophagus putrescentiae]|nr:hypothetical protein TYRP_017042 [Tyrophagus putrescentiae]